MKIPAWKKEILCFFREKLRMERLEIDWMGFFLRAIGKLWEFIESWLNFLKRFFSLFFGWFNSKIYWSSSNPTVFNFIAPGCNIHSNRLDHFELIHLRILHIRVLHIHLSQSLSLSVWVCVCVFLCMLECWRGIFFNLACCARDYTYLGFRLDLLTM